MTKKIIQNQTMNMLALQLFLRPAHYYATTLQDKTFLFKKEVFRNEAQTLFCSEIF